MAGGLMQVVSYGTQDLTLTGNPQITFFHTVYRRYTNFGKKFIELSFDNLPDFNSVSYINIPKNNGDLLSKIILKIKLPKINFSHLNTIISNIDMGDSTNNQILTFIKNGIPYYNFFLSFYNNLKNLIKIFFQNYDNINNNLSYIQDLKNYILKYNNVDQFNTFFNTIDYFYNNVISENTKKYNVQLYTNSSLFKFANNELIYIYDKFTFGMISYDGFKFLIQKNMEILDELNTQIYDIIKNNVLEQNKKITVCWVNKIGAYLINSIEFYIGSNKIYSLSDTYINNYSELYYKNKTLYDKMIGNNSILNNFAEIINEEFLYLPIPFWNLSNYGLAFPLISLQYNSLQIKINTKKFLDCVRIDTSNYSTNTTNNLSNKINNEIINILSNNYELIVNSKLEITLLLELIYLDSIERNKFARSAHEYLIEQVQQIEFNKISPNNNTIQLDIFHCCKDMFWFVEKVLSIKDVFNGNKDVFSYIYPMKILNYNKIQKNKVDLLRYTLIFIDPKTKYNPFVFNQGLYVIDNNLKFLTKLSIIIEYFNNKFVYPSSLLKLNRIIDSSAFYLNGTELFIEKFYFFNYLHPYIYYNSVPQFGLNVYSFCLNPIEFQPTGSCNMSRISFIGLKLKINDRTQDDFITQFLEDNSTDILNEEYKLIFQTRNFNVLRIIGGIGATAYTYN